MKALIAPGVVLMRRLSLVKKFLLVSFFLLLPLAYTAFLYFNETQKQVTFMTAERDGLRYLQPLLKLGRLVQDHRGLTYVIAKGDEQNKPLRAEVQQKIRTVIAEVNAVEKELGPNYGSAAQWRKVTDKLNTLTANEVSSDSEGVFSEHVKLIEEIQALIDLVTMRSNLLLDADTASYLLMDLITTTVPKLSERVAIARGVGTALIMRAELMTDDRVRMSVLEALAEEHAHSLRSNLAIAMKESKRVTTALNQSEKDLSAVAEFIGDIGFMQSPGGLTVMTGDAFFKSGTAALDKLSGFSDKALPLLDSLLRQRINEYRTQDLLIQGLAFVCLALALYLFFAFYYTVKSGIAFLKKALGRVAEGDLTGKIDARASDEIGSLTHTLRDTQTRLAELMLEINRAAEHVYLASNQISDANENLSQRTESQASTLEQTSASLEELTSTVQRNAESANDANELSQDSARTAEDGRASMKHLAITMSEIESSTAKIGEIISLIDSIAFQTNILALNAAVEAARAGEQGRGFAVVAAEVRNLAHHSADAAKQIKGLVAQTREKVSVGVHSVDDTLKTIQESLVSTKRVAALINEIAAASREQSDGISQVNRAVIQMDDANQQNAAMVEQATATTESLKDQANALVSTVGRFKVDGRASEVPMVALNKVHAANLNVSVPQHKPSPVRTQPLTAQTNEEWTEF